MNKKEKQSKKFSRRTMLLGLGKLGLFAGLFGRMFYLQIVKNEEFVQLSENNHIKTEIIPPLRGQILDRFDHKLTINEQIYELIFEKLPIHNDDLCRQIALKIGDILKYDPKQQADLINSLIELDLGDIYSIKENLSWSDLVSLELFAYDLQGTDIQTDYSRLYPHAELFGHIIGYVGTISENEKKKNAVNFYHNLKVGKNGIEKTQDKLLHGITGLNRIEVNAKGEFIRDISTSKSIPGQNIQISIDTNLQKTASNALSENTGVILVSKISNGEILALVSKPSFNPNLFNNGISSANWDQLINNPELPLINRAVSLTYPPGSGFKINVAIAALKEKFNPETKFTCPGYHVVGDRVFQCWKKTGHGTINLYQAIAGSCNVYFWNVARIIGIQPFANMARQMGFQQKLLNNTLPREQIGIIPDPAWKEQKYGQKWLLSDTINAAIGQGYVEATPIQILTMVMRIASGKSITPTIFKNGNNEIIFPSLDLDNELAIVRKGMEMVVNENIGTAYLNRIMNPDYLMAGKTGTAQVISKRHKDDDLSKENVVKKIRNHGIFVAYAPMHKPEYAFCGVIEHGGFPSLAIKSARELLTEAQIRNL